MSTLKLLFYLCLIVLFGFVVFHFNNGSTKKSESTDQVENVQEKRKPPTQKELDKKNEVISLRKAKRNKKSNPQSILKDIQELTNQSYNDDEIDGINFFGGMVKNLTIDRSNPNRLVLATETSGAWVGIKDGMGEFEWQPIDDDHAETAWESVAQHPSNPDIFFFGSRYDGLHYADLSTNNGILEFVGAIEELDNGAITLMQNHSFAQVNVMKTDPLDPDHIYLAGGTLTFINSLGNIAAYNNVYRFDGTTATIGTQDMWSNMIDGGDKSRFGDIEIISSETFIAGHKKRNIRFSTDSNLYTVWNEPSGNPYIELTKITNPQNVSEHIIYSQHILPSGSRRIYQSIDEGSSWTSVYTTGLLANSHSWLLDAIPLNNGKHILLSGSVLLSGLVFDTNFNQITNTSGTLETVGAHDDYHAAEFSGDDVYVVTDGGVHHTTKSQLETHIQNNSIIDFTSLNRTFSGSLQVNEVGFSELDDHYTAGIWHSGTGIYDPGIAGLTKFSFGDGFGTCFQPRTTNRFYTTKQGGYVYRGQFNSATQSYLRYPISLQNFSSNKASGFETDIFTHPFLPGKLFGIGTTGLHRCNNASAATMTNSVGSNVEADWSEPYTTSHNIYLNGIYDATFPDWDGKFYYGLTNNENGDRSNPANELEFYRVPNLNAGSMTPSLLSNITMTNNGQPLVAVDVSRHADMDEGSFYAGVDKTGVGFGIYKIENAQITGNETIELLGSSTDLDGLTPLQIVVSPFNEDVIIVGTYFGLFASIDGGNSYSPVLEIPAVRIKDLKYKASENELFIGTYGRGVWKAKINNEIVDCAYISYSDYSLSEGEDLTIKDNTYQNPGIQFIDQSTPGTFIKNIELSFYLRLNGINTPGATLFLTTPDGTMTEYDFDDMVDIPNPIPNAPWVSLRKLNINFAQTEGDMSEWELNFEAPTDLQFDIAHTILNYTSIELSPNGDCDGDGLDNSEELALNRNPEDFNDFGFELNDDNQHWIRSGNVYRTYTKPWGIYALQKGNDGHITSHSFNFNSEQLDGILIRYRSQQDGVIKVFAQNHEDGEYVLVGSRAYDDINTWQNMNIYFNSPDWNNLNVNSLRIEFPDSGNVIKRSYINYIRPILPSPNFTESHTSQIVQSTNQALLDEFKLSETKSTPSSLSFYPNPSHEIIYLDNKDFQIENIFDSHGRSMLKQIKFLNPNTLNISSLNNGNYFIQVNNKLNQRELINIVKL